MTEASSFLMDLKRLVFFAGKGGVGKTTVSCAYALKCSKEGVDILLVSTDPAHSTDKVFETTLGNEPGMVREGLYAKQIDTEKESRKHMKAIENEMRQVVSPETLSNLKSYLEMAHSSPGVEEAAMLDAIIDTVRDMKTRKIVFDTAPTGQTLRLLNLPKFLDSWSSGLINRRKEDLERLGKIDGTESKTPIKDPLVEKLKERKGRLDFGKRILQEKSSIVPVLTPERLSVMETTESLKQLKELGIDIPGVIINKISKGLGEGRMEYEKKVIEEIEEKFKILGRIPMMEEEIIGTKKLKDVSKRLNFL